MNKKRTIRRIENIIGFISIIAIIVCLGCFIAMIEAGEIIIGSIIAIVICMIWFGIIATYHYIVNRLFNK